MAPAAGTPSRRSIARLLSALSILAAAAATAYLLYPAPFADAFFAGIVSLSVLFALVGGIGAWTDRTPLVWVAALLLSGLTIVGMLSIGYLIAPAAVLLLGAAVFSHLAGPRTEVREAIVADPPARGAVVRRGLLGGASVLAGGALLYAGAIERGLFGSCASETVACALEVTNWGAVGLSVLGLAAVGVGGWLLWKQTYVARVLATSRAR